MSLPLRCFVALLLVSSYASALSAASYTISIIPNTGERQLKAYAINDLGQVAGYGETRAFLYSNGISADLGTLGGCCSRAFGINNLGQVVGNTSDGDFANGERSGAFVYASGVMSPIPNAWSAPGQSLNADVALDINNSGAIASNLGRIYTSSGFSTVPSLPSERPRSTTAYGINDLGVVTGFSEIYSRATVPADWVRHAYLWDSVASNLVDLGTLGGRESYGWSINNLNAVAGESNTIGGATHAFVYSNGLMTDLGSLGAGSADYSAAFGINDFGQAVGVTGTDPAMFRPFIYANGVMTDLFTLVSPQDIEDWGPAQARAINNFGQVTGFGVYRGEITSFLLSPVPELPSSYLLLIGLALAIRVKRPSIADA